MHTAHILRKYDPLEWGGTETAVLRLLDGLRSQNVGATVYCPRLKVEREQDPFVTAGIQVQRFNSFVPVLGISADQREQLVRWGGNIMSFQLYRQLMNDPLDVIHTHALNRLAGVGLMAARRRNLPLVVTIHGGALDLPGEVESKLTAPLRGGLEWGKIIGLLIQSRKVLEKADAILACNPREVELLSHRYPQQRVLLQQHSVPAANYAKECRSVARQAFPLITQREVILCVARLDPVKNQLWLVQQLPAMLAQHPKVLLVLAGPDTSQGYGDQVRQEVERLGLKENVLFTGPLEPGSDLLVGLMQEAKAMLLPSTSETFGLAILEAWAAGTPIISSRTSGASSLIKHQENGWLFNLDQPRDYLAALKEALAGDDDTRRVIDTARTLVRSTYDTVVAAARVKRLYEELSAGKKNGKRSA